MAPMINCEQVPLFYEDPATLLLSSCLDLCAFRDIRVRREDCLRYCPDYYYCTQRGSTTPLPCASTTGTGEVETQDQLLQNLPWILIPTFVITFALCMMIFVVSRKLCHQGKAEGRNKSLIISQPECPTDDQYKSESYDSRTYVSVEREGKLNISVPKQVLGSEGLDERSHSTEPGVGLDSKYEKDKSGSADSGISCTSECGETQEKSSLLRGENV